MREILFRGKSKHRSKWVYGWFCGKTLNHDMDGTEECSQIIDVETLYWHVVEPETVGQFTGRTDKNGKKVFEHDILQIYTVWADGTAEKAGIGIVKWRENDQCYVLVTEEGYHIDDFGNYGRPEYYEVIGNTHEF